MTYSKTNNPKADEFVQQVVNIRCQGVAKAKQSEYFEDCANKEWANKNEDK